MSHGRNSRPEDADPIAIHFPQWGRPGIAKIEARYDKEVGWQITITPNVLVLSDPEYCEQWDRFMSNTEHDMRLWLLQERDPNSIEQRREIQGFFDTGTAINSDRIDLPKKPDHSYTINVYGSYNDCKLELALVFDSLRTWRFKERVDEHGDRASHKLLISTDEIMIKHYAPEFAYYMSQRNTGPSPAP